MQRILLLVQSLQASLQALGGEGINIITHETAVGRHLLVKFEAFSAHGAHRWMSGRERAALSVTDYSRGPGGDNEKHTPICRVPDIVFWPMLPSGYRHLLWNANSRIAAPTIRPRYWDLTVS
jgi:hypothetical protein